MSLKFKVLKQVLFALNIGCQVYYSLQQNAQYSIESMYTSNINMEGTEQVLAYLVPYFRTPSYVNELSQPVSKSTVT